jgi:homospermidine synthase
MSHSFPETRKLIMLGYGAVAKCTLHYLSRYITISEDRIYLIDQSKDAFYGPNIEHVHRMIVTLDVTTFMPLLDMIGVNEGDIVIDLTFSTPTYHFIHVCALLGLHYVNTSIEDGSDTFRGSSIHHQQFIVENMLSTMQLRSCILTECGQNPGLIQHYVLYALNKLYQEYAPDDPNRDKEFRKEVLTEMIHTYQIGSILMSERDQLITNRIMKPGVLYNTWSVGGFLSEALDPAEVVRGSNNPYIQPIFHTSDLHEIRMKQYESYQESGTEVLFLRANGLHASLPSMAPLMVNDTISFQSYKGNLIHHGEIFELARYFGESAPFMSYVYQSSPYINSSLYYLLSKGYEKEDLLLHVQANENYSVMDNINMEHPMTGFDSIGCTLFCGKEQVERMFWCGSILSDTDNIAPEFTPTVVQVAAGILSGLSYLLEPERKPGYYQPCDIDTLYMLEKAKPLLGTFLFTEINDPFRGPLEYTVL